MASAGSATTKAAVLEAFAEACTEVAKGLAPKGSTIGWDAGKEGLVHFHCPLIGLRGAHTWTGSPRASAWLTRGVVEATCTKCVGDKKTYPDQASYELTRAEYTDQVKRAVRWEEFGVVQAGFRTIVLRSHLYVDRDFQQVVRRDKVRYEDGRKERGNTSPWRWRSAKLVKHRPGEFEVMRAEPWLAQHYPELDRIYDALCWYGIELFVDPTGTGSMSAAGVPLKATYRTVLTEGEKDADSFNALMVAGGYTNLIATCLCHPKPTKLASHHIRLLAGHEVIVIGDADDPGKDHADNWASLVWPHVPEVKLVREQLELAGTPEEKDLTDWIVKRVGPPPAEGSFADWLVAQPTAKAVADELVNLFASVAPLIEPPGRPTEWRTNLILLKSGPPKADSHHNAEKVWTQHPLLKGRVRTNIRSGEIEVIDPPWGGGVVTGATDAAILCAMWLERTERMSLSAKALEEVVRQELVAPPFNPLADLLATSWDGKPRLDGLFTDYVPLKARPADLALLARTMMADLVRKLRGELISQRLLIAIETGQALDVAGALLGRHGYQHRGKVSEREIARILLGEVALIQITQEPIANRQAALASLPHLFAGSVFMGRRRLVAPLFLAVGTPPVDPRTLAKIDERVFRFKLLERRARLDDLREDAPQLIAEAVAQLDGSVVTVIPDKSEQDTLDRLDLLAELHVVVRALWLFVMCEVENVDLFNPRSFEVANRRTEPRRHVVRDQFVTTMRALIQADREVSSPTRAFNAVTHAFGWQTKLGLTSKMAKDLGIDIGGQEKCVVVGVLMTDERINQLRQHLFPNPDQVDGGDGDEGSPLPPKGEEGGGVEEVSQFAGFATVCQNGLPPGNQPGLPGLLEPYAYKEEKKKETEDDEKISKLDNSSSETNIVSPRAYTHEDSSKKEGGAAWLADQAAVDAAHAILTTPGWCAIDFETWPTAPAWHGDDAAARALPGEKGAQRAKAVLDAQKNGRARQRRACTLQLAHEDGRSVACALVRGTDAERATQLQAMFAGRVADLVAHNAQFETEVLLKHGITVDLECTMLAGKALHLVAMPDGEPQEQGFGLADLVLEELGRTRNKTIRDRDWRDPVNLDAEAAAYGIADACDALELWQLYRNRLAAKSLLEGYQLMQRALLPTAATNLRGLMLDEAAHAALMARMAADAATIAGELSELCSYAIDNHGSSPQVSTWILERILGMPLKPVVKPKLISLVPWLKAQGGLKPDPAGELKALGIRGLIKPKAQLDLVQAARAAWAAGYRWSGALLVALVGERDGNPVLTRDDDLVWVEYMALKDDYDRLHTDDEHRMINFGIKLRAATNNQVRTWKLTKTGHLAITKGGKLRKAEQLAEAFPLVSQYLVKHAQWTRSTKLLDSFGETLQRWQDKDGRCCGQFKVWAAWTGRQSCSDPNLQNQPREPEFRALWVAPPGRKLVVADYSQIELRLLAVESGDEVLRGIYRANADIHREVAAAAFNLPAEEVSKELRTRAKAISFGIAYGSGPAGLAEAGGFALDEAALLLERVLTAYPGLRMFRQDAPVTAARNHHIAIRPGRQARYDPAHSSPTQAINAPIQGGAASVQMLALRLVHDALVARPYLDSFIAAAVHDEFLIELPAEHAAEVATLLVDGMTEALVSVYPEVVDMQLHKLTEAAIVDTWASKP